MKLSNRDYQSTTDQNRVVRLKFRESQGLVPNSEKEIEYRLFKI